MAPAARPPAPGCAQDKFRECGSVVYANVMHYEDGAAAVWGGGGGFRAPELQGRVASESTRAPGEQRQRGLGRPPSLRHAPWAWTGCLSWPAGQPDHQADEARRNAGACACAGRSKGWGIVEFETPDEVRAAQRCHSCAPWRGAGAHCVLEDRRRGTTTPESAAASTAAPAAAVGVAAQGVCSFWDCSPLGAVLIRLLMGPRSRWRQTQRVDAAAGTADESRRGPRESCRGRRLSLGRAPLPLATSRTLLNRQPCLADRSAQAATAINTLNGVEMSGRRLLVREDREDRDLKHVAGGDENGASPAPRAPRPPRAAGAPGGRGTAGGRGAGGRGAGGRGGRGSAPPERSGESSGLQVRPRHALPALPQHPSCGF